jgi:hypothetical protein
MLIGDGDGCKRRASLPGAEEAASSSPQVDEEPPHLAGVAHLGAWKGSAMRSTKLALFGIFSAVSLGLGSASGQAAPAAGNPAGVMAAVDHQSKPQEIAYRRCWRRNGQRVCRWYESPYRDYGGGYGYYGPMIPEAYPPGTSRWWQEMDRQDRGGRPRP